MKIFLSLLSIALAHAENVKTIHLCEQTVAQASISTRGTVLEFPAEPEKVIMGTKGAFSIEYVRRDLAISPLMSSARSNLFVYLAGRRFVLELNTSPMPGNTVYFIKDCLEDRRGTEDKHHGRK